MIVLGVLSISILTYIVAGLGITTYRLPFDGTIEGLLMGVFIIALAVSAALHIAGGIFCHRREYWRVCLASASFAVFIGVFGVLFFARFYWIVWVPLVAAVISIIFISLRKKEWQEISDSVDGKVSYDD